MMHKSNDSCIVPGEAPESDEETTIRENFPRGLESISNLVVAGEAAESDNEKYAEKVSAVRTIKPKVEEPKYNSLLHRKLRESNYKFKENLAQLVCHNLKLTSDQIYEINQGLLNNQIEIQHTFKYLRKSTLATSKMENIMSYILTQNFLPSINTDV